MFDTRGAVLLTPPGWDEPDPPDLGDWEPIPEELWHEARKAAPGWVEDGAMAFADEPIDDAMRLPLGPHTWRLLTESAIEDLSAQGKAWALRRAEELKGLIDAYRAELIASLAGPKPADPAEDWASHDVAV
ncbi:MAG TPA: hypothetical protein VG650_13710, partial [Mycobacteriales bacterium]|nr:hypothetical protein [Mycobacteriales bacterium]